VIVIDFSGVVTGGTRLPTFPEPLEIRLNPVRKSVRLRGGGPGVSVRQAVTKSHVE